VLAHAYPLVMFPDGFWTSSIWKEAARAGLRQISRMVGEGNFAGASQLAKTPGVLKPSAAGSQIQHLGRGGEGLATMVAHPDHGVAVRKLYDPRGISGSEMIGRKEQAGRALGDNPVFSKFLGSSQTPQGGQMHFNEYIQPGQAPTGQAGAQSVRHAQTQAQRGLTQAGFAGGKDIREGNMIYDAKAGQHRVIDYMPAQKGEFQRLPKSMENRLAVTPESPDPFNPDYNPQKGNTGGMLGRLLGGKSQSGGLRETPSTMSAAKTGPVPSMGQTNAGRPGMARGTPKPMPATSVLTPQKPLGSQSPTMPLTPTSNSSPTSVLKPQAPPALASNAPATAVVRKPRPPVS
jgi:hypothetical protein